MSSTSAPHQVGSRRFLEFSLLTESFALPLESVREVLALGEVTPIPSVPNHVKGVMNLRGQVITVVDMRTKFRMKTEAYQAETAIIILDNANHAVGIIVDTVNSVISLEDEAISRSPEIESSVASDYIAGIARVEKKLILLLDMEKALGKNLGIPANPKISA